MTTEKRLTLRKVTVRKSLQEGVNFILVPDDFLDGELVDITIRSPRPPPVYKTVWLLRYDDGTWWGNDEESSEETWVENQYYAMEFESLDEIKKFKLNQFDAFLRSDMTIVRRKFKIS